MGFVNFRKNIYGILKILPEPDSSIGEWIAGANAAFQENEIEIELKIKKFPKRSQP